MPALTITAVDHTTGQLTIPAHGLNTGDGPGALFAPAGAGGILPTGFAPVTSYWAIRVDANTVKLATSSTNANAGIAIGCSDNGTLPLQLGVGLPYRVPMIAAAGAQVKSANDNAVWQVIAALWAFLTGQLQALWSGLTLAGPLTVGGQPFTIANLTYTAAVTDLITVTAHGLVTGDGPVQTSSTGALPGGLAATTNYWVFVVDANTFKLATSFSNALAGVAVDITSTGSGVHTLLCLPSTMRPADATVSRNIVVGGAIRHAITTLNLPLRYEHSAALTGSIIVTLSGGNDGLLIGIPLKLGDRILACRAAMQDNTTGPTKLKLQLMSSTGVTNVIATSPPSSGGGTLQTLTLSGLSTAVVAGTSYYVLISFSTGTAASIIANIEVDYDHP